jgi:hypothetical protein
MRCSYCFLPLATLFVLTGASLAPAQPAKVIVKKDVVYGRVHGACIRTGPARSRWRIDLRCSPARRTDRRPAKIQLSRKALRFDPLCRGHLYLTPGVVSKVIILHARRIPFPAMAEKGAQTPRNTPDSMVFVLSTGEGLSVSIA